MKPKLVLVIALLAAPALAQTMSPAIAECGKHCQGEFTVTNNTVQPTAVTLTPYSFGLSPAGETQLRALDNGVDVQLDAMAARVGPKGEHTFSYRIRCTQTPCNVMIYAGMVVGHTNEGLAVRVLLPHVVYVDDKAKGARARARKAAGIAEGQ